MTTSEIPIETVFDEILAYHAGMCKAMHSDEEKYRKYFNKAEAAREILVRLIRKMPKGKQPEIGKMLERRTSATFEAMFLDRSAWAQGGR